MLLIDSDILVYRVGFAIEADPYGINAGRYNIQQSIMRMINETGDCKYRCFLTGKDNFRKTRAHLTPYKGSRAIKDRPKYYDDLRAVLINEWKAEVIDGMEADDALGIEMTKCYTEPTHEGDTGSCTATICSIDKDLLMIPGKHYNFVKKEFKTINKLEGYRNFAKQMLTGDTTDCIPGIAGLGPKTADALMAEAKTEEEMDTIIFNTYKKNIKDGVLKLKQKVDYSVTTDDDIVLLLAELRDLLWIRREAI